MEQSLKMFKEDKLRLEQAKQKARAIETDRIKLEAELEHLRRQENEILDKCKALGYNSKEELAQALVNKMTLLNETINRLDALMSGKSVSFDDTNVDDVLPEETVLEPKTESLAIEDMDLTDIDSLAFDEENETLDLDINLETMDFSDLEF